MNEGTVEQIVWADQIHEGDLVQMYDIEGAPWERVTNLRKDDLVHFIGVEGPINRARYFARNRPLAIRPFVPEMEDGE